MDRIYLGVFEMFGSPSARGVSAWAHPRSDLTRFHDIGHWVELAKTLDDAGFDWLFFADSFGYPTIGGEMVDAAARYGINFPLLDPQMLLPILAASTRDLGLVVTETTGLHHPFETARRFATLDHIAGGRLGMNVVTGSVQNVVADLFGHERMREHDLRYDMAQEYLDVARRYWEQSWDDGAVIADPTSPIYVDPAKLHRIEHDGTFYRSSGYLTVDPSPQRTPVIFQAGSSGRGKEFAAANADCVLLQSSAAEQMAANIADIRARAAAHGRDPRSVKVVATQSFFVAEDAEDARALQREFRDMQTVEVAAAMFVSNTGIDLLSLDPGKPLSQIPLDDVVGQMGQSNIDRFVGPDGAGPTVGEILEQLRVRGIRGSQIVGTPTAVADQIEEFLEATDLDGLMVDPLFGAEDVRDFARLVMPELRRRGRLGERGTQRTLRDQLFSEAPATIGTP
ncbi:NtaA/DmoA family FMN-dependent monooxygenase [Microbacterium thalassium]|uniref:FMN-dependent oxidoreductase (Nitrilotriacetate monooxygenase family) n=1 Tax=Microbacterium thalassium TaxID=362649 RepID=A0A7X0FN87_9MICO|nr:NtaA/DmoA family FMN-dependent monooxygenase [Microbacterium thalassium]MBB6390539.1 FMN-dependent oxidoreductase (nitrilotriacetate monooxygenase family) [Microbacterium thalassium]GLK25650.1 N5,N10-methylene tetrahydromethanopterin reductase [Microbacterium thalassium]